MFTPDTFVSACRQCVGQGGDAIAIQAIVRDGLRSQSSEPSSWDREELLYRSPELTIVNLTLPGLGRSPIHDHGMWAVIGISTGCEVERFYEMRGGRPEEVERIQVQAGDAICLAKHVIHATENPGEQAARGLHVYGGDLVTAARRMWNPRTGTELPFHSPTFEKWAEELSTKAIGDASGGRVGAAPLVHLPRG
jgi:predicted metal-dependent enzyme (double-stranded beta helix superfamily)